MIDFSVYTSAPCGSRHLIKKNPGLQWKYTTKASIFHPTETKSP